MRNTSSMHGNIAGLHLEPYTLAIVVQRPDTVEAVRATSYRGVAFVRVRVKVRRRIVLERPAMRPMISADGCTDAGLGQVVW